MISNFRISRVSKGIAVGAVVALVTIATLQAQSPKTKSSIDRSDSEHAGETAALKQAFSGASVDIFFDSADLDVAKPGLSGLKYLDHVDVTGKELLRFEKGGGETWIIDPDTVFAYRAKKSGR